ncbi:MAG: aminopeptidase [Chloroflexi bacterium]|nr:aminopeptidase [Chloroflexota bacterium]
MNPDFETRLDAYAELIVCVGLNIQPGQRLFVRAPRENPALVHRVARAAYHAGAEDVQVYWEDDVLDLIRVERAPRQVLDQYPDWVAYAYNTSSERGDAFLLTFSPDPALFQNQDPERADLFRRARVTALRPMLQKQARNGFTWLAARVPTQAWAARLFPNAAPAVQQEKLWDAIFSMCRVDGGDPVAAWREHLDALEKRRAYMNAKQYAALHFKSLVTDLTLGLPRGHVWEGGQSVAENGVTFVANIPTEEIFTLPHRAQARGYVTTTRPISINGVLIEQFALAFENGRITRVVAQNYQAALEKMVASDQGAAHLGEVALVAASNPIGRSKLLFYDGLYDENAASHIAIGRAYRFSLGGGETMSAQEFEDAGGNDSAIHEDFMIGSSEMDVDGILEDGSREAVMRQGEFAFEAS